METGNSGSNIYREAVTTTKDSMGLTAEQRTFAWIALAAGIIALVWWLMRTPANETSYGTSSDAEQGARARNTGNTR